MNGRMAAAISALLLAAATHPARAACTDLEFFTGDDLYAQCSAATADADFQPRQARCTGYVIGVSDSLQAAQGAGQAGKVCILPANTAAQLTDAAKQYLTAHPEKRHLAAQDLVAEALGEAFPCK